MDREHESGSERRGPEGQKYEYLVLSLYEGAVGLIKRKHSYSSGQEIDPLAIHYNSQFKKISDEQKTSVSLSQMLNLLGQDSWRLVEAVNESRSEGTGSPLLFFERLTIEEE